MLHLHELVEKLPPGPRKTLAEAALDAALRGVPKDEQRKEAAETRQNTKFQLTLVFTIIFAIALIPLTIAKIITVPQAGVGACVLAGASYVTKLFQGKPGSSEEDA